MAAFQLENLAAVRTGRIPVDLWSGALVALVAILELKVSPSFALLLFVVVPFIALAQRGWRRLSWLAAAGGTCAVLSTLDPVEPGVTAMRLGLVAAVATGAVALDAAVRREGARADLERALAREANHRIKNDLQMVADLVMLDSGEAASRVRSIATVHRLLTESEDRVDAAALVRSITAGSPVSVDVRVSPTRLDAVTAQRLGLVVNELVTNAYRHGAAPIVVELDRGRLRVDDGGSGPGSGGGFGLDLVRSIVERGLRGTFELTVRSDGGTRAEVNFPA